MPPVRGKAMARRDLMRRVGRLDQVAGVRLVTLGDGIERGVRVLEFRTGTGYAFDVLVDRSLDVGRCELNGRALAWLSPTGVVGPWFAEPMGLGWFRSWGGGMMVTCGLDHTLLGGVDDASNFHQLVRPTEEYGLHGRSRPPGGGFRRVDGAPPPHRSPRWREPFHGPRRGRQRRLRSSHPHVPVPRQCRLAGGG